MSNPFQLICVSGRSIHLARPSTDPSLRVTVTARTKLPTMAASPAKIGILSIGDMGMGIAKLLLASGFAVATNCKGRR